MGLLFAIMVVSTGLVPARDGPRDHGFHPLRVSRVIAETEGTVSIALEVPSELADTFVYRAGQFVTFRFTIDGQQQLRSYSMSSSPDVDDEFRVTVKQVDAGLVSTLLTQTLAAGDLVETTRPAGVFTLTAGKGTGDLIAFAGGSGITPVFSLLKSALVTTSRRVRLLYANRDSAGVIFRKELDALSQRYGDKLEVTHHLDTNQGFVQRTDIGSYVNSTPDSDYYVCGPGPFMDLVDATLRERGVDVGRIHIERFTPAAPVEPAPVGALEPQLGGAAPAPAQVTITLNGKTQTAEHRPGITVLQTARSMGMAPPFSCEAGDCATCMAKIIEGEADMIVNNALLPDEVTEGWILTCQAVPTTASIRVEYGYGDI